MQFFNLLRAGLHVQGQHIFGSGQFLPLLGHYSQLVGQRLGSKLAKLAGANKPASGQPRPTLAESFPDIFDSLCSSPLLLLETGLFDESVLKPWFQPEAVMSGGKLIQWKRLVSVELLLRRLRELEF